MNDPAQIRELRTALRYANGYRELAMYADALRELDKLPPPLADHDDVARMRLAVQMAAQKWKRALPAAQLLSERHPNDPGNFVNLAYVARRAQSLPAARAILEYAALRFPSEPIIHYNLACYACQDGNHEAARNGLAKAISLDPKCLELARRDSDLSAIKSWIQSL